MNLKLKAKALHCLAGESYLSAWFDRYWLNQVGVSAKNIAATNLLWLWRRLGLGDGGDRDTQK